LPDGLRIGDSSTVHLRNKGIHFALQGLPRLLSLSVESLL
jgi:hypothetical protein